MSNEIRDLSVKENKDSSTSEKSLTMDDLTLTSASIIVPPGPSVGQQLRAAREAKNLSPTDVAQILKLSVRQVHALEADDWLNLPAAIVRGFIRNYARALNLNSDALMGQLDILSMPQPPELELVGTNTTALPSAGRIERRDLIVIFSGFVLVILAVLAYFFVPDDFWQSKLTSLIPSTQEPKLAVPVDNDADTPPSSAASEPAIPQGVAANADPGSSKQPPETASEVVPSAPSEKQGAASGPSSLKLSFARASWVEIRDRSGQIIFSQLNPAGSEREIKGQPPLAVVIGNASGVTAQYKGKAVDIPQRNKDDVARLNLE